MREIVCLCLLLLRWKSEMHSLSPPSSSSSVCWNVPRKREREWVKKCLSEGERETQQPAYFYPSSLSSSVSSSCLCKEKRAEGEKLHARSVYKLQNDKKATHQLFRPYKTKIVLISICECIFVVLHKLSTMHETVLHAGQKPNSKPILFSFNSLARIEIFLSLLSNRTLCFSLQS